MSFEYNLIYSYVRLQARSFGYFLSIFVHDSLNCTIYDRIKFPRDLIFLLSMKVWAYTVEFAFACRWYMSGVLLWSEISWMIYRIVNLSTCGYIVGIEIRMNSFWFYLYLKLSNPDKMSSDFGCDSLCSWWDFKKCIKAELSIMSAIENYYVIEQWLVSPSTKWKFDNNQPLPTENWAR